MTGTLPSDLAMQILDEAADGVLVTIQGVSGFPIIYANAAFTRMTGYSLDETLGRSCNFLQGQDRGQPEIVLMRAAIAAGRAITVILRNYRRDGSMFYNEVRLAPLYRRAGETPAHYYVGFQRDVTARVDIEMRRRLDDAHHS